MKEYDIGRLLGEMDFVKNSFQTTPNNLMLTNYEIEILNRYGIDYQNCQTLKQVLSEVEEVILNMEITDEELEKISASIAERDYYENTHH